MTPKEKAEELCRKMLYEIEWNAQPSTVKGVAKQCALIAVEEIIQELDHLPFDDQDFGTFKMKYWQEVKKEIERL